MAGLPHEPGYACRQSLDKHIRWSARTGTESSCE